MRILAILLLLVLSAIVFAVSSLPVSDSVSASITPINPATPSTPVISNNEYKIGMANPAAVYCTGLGYNYKVTKGPSGEYGTCIFPDKTECDEWQFLEGKCGQQYSYCAKQGYGIKTMSDGKNAFSKEYAVCTSADKSTDMGSVSKLFDLETKSVKASVSVATPAEKVASVSATQTGTSLNLPSDFDWRNYNGKNYMTPVKDQGSCGSCWAFATVGTVESAYNIRNSPMPELDLSEQYLMSCGPVNRCSWGGYAEEGFRLINSSGISDELCFPYQATDLSCNLRCSDWATRLWKTEDYGVAWWVNYDPEPTLMKELLIQYGPVETGVWVGNGASWGGGILRCGGYQGIDHAVIIVGYNDSGGYWIAKNSWGSTWNGDGYFKVAYNDCGIGGDNHYAIAPLMEPATLPDIKINSLWYTPSNPWVGSSLTAYVNISNAGNTSIISPFITKIYFIGNPSQSCVINTTSILTSGASFIASCKYNITGSFFIVVTTDLFNTIAESNEGNNIMTTYIAPSLYPPCNSTWFCRNSQTLAFRDEGCQVSYYSCGRSPYICCSKGQCVKDVSGDICNSRLMLSQVPADNSIAQVEGPSLDGKLPFAFGLAVVLGLAVYAFIWSEIKRGS